MARSVRRRRLSTRQHRSTPYSIPSYHWNTEDVTDRKKNRLLCSEKKREWEDSTCSVCMEYPHNAVLLLCSSHDKGCRPYMCGTSDRHSNCLDQFRKAYTKETGQKPEAIELSCPLCRGEVKGWTVVEPARDYLNSKKRSCMQDDCSFVGSYRELHKHVKSVHPSARPRDVDPAHEQKWRTLEHDRERQDVISTIRSSMPRAVVFGDYVIEMDGSDEENDERGSHDISRRILYFFLHEGARLMRLQTENAGSEEREEESGYDSVNGISGPDVSAAYSADVDDEAVASVISAQGRGMDVARSERRRRRRRRSRGRSGIDLS